MQRGHLARHLYVLSIGTTQWPASRAGEPNRCRWRWEHHRYGNRRCERRRHEPGHYGNLYRGFRLQRHTQLCAGRLIPKLRGQGEWLPGLLHRDGAPGRDRYALWRSGENLEEHRLKSAW